MLPHELNTPAGSSVMNFLKESSASWSGLALVAGWELQEKQQRGKVTMMKNREVTGGSISSVCEASG